MESTQPQAESPLTSSWMTDPSERLEAQCHAILKGITLTRQGQSKSWLNVQPCVVEATASLVPLVLAHSRRLTAVEEKLDQVRQVLEVLVKDRQVKETRYQMDQRAHEDAHQLVGRAVQDLQVSLETERQAQHDFQERVILAELRDVQERVRRLENRGPLATSPEPASQEAPPPTHRGGTRAQPSRRQRRQRATSRQAQCPRSPTTSSSASSSRSSSSSSACGRSQTKRKTRHSSEETRALTEAVRQLRAQWRRFVELQTTTHVVSLTNANFHTTDEAAHEATGEKCAEADEGIGRDYPSPLPLPGVRGGCAAGARLPPQRGRWCWLGEGGTHFPSAGRSQSPRAQRAAGRLHPAGTVGAAASPPLAWNEQRLYDSRTDCWYSTGSCQYEAPSSSSAGADRLGEGPSHRRWTCFTWVRPSLIRIERAGIYKVLACLVRDGPPTSTTGGESNGGVTPKDPSLVIEVEDNLRGLVCQITSDPADHLSATRVFFSEPGRRCASPQTSRRVSPARAHQRTRSPTYHPYDSASAGPFVPSPFADASRRRSAAHSPARFVRECCGPAQSRTYTLNDYLFLSAGALLKVRCRHVQDTRAVYEAFLELEYMA